MSGLSTAGAQLTSGLGAGASESEVSFVACFGKLTPSEHIRWLYALRLTINANFPLTNKASGIKNDSPLGDGWGHWVPATPYNSHIQKLRLVPIA
jgi:hypothetical protein